MSGSACVTGVREHTACAAGKVFLASVILQVCVCCHISPTSLTNGENDDAASDGLMVMPM